MNHCAQELQVFQSHHRPFLRPAVVSFYSQLFRSSGFLPSAARGRWDLLRGSGCINRGFEHGDASSLSAYPPLHTLTSRMQAFDEQSGADQLAAQSWLCDCILWHKREAYWKNGFRTA